MFVAAIAVYRVSIVPPFVNVRLYIYVLWKSMEKNAIQWECVSRELLIRNGRNFGCRGRGRGRGKGYVTLSLRMFIVLAAQKPCTFSFLHADPDVLAAQKPCFRVYL